MVKLSVKDMKILRELDFGARQPISQIAKKVGLSPEVTHYRIKQLEKQGIITGYYPVIDLSKLGYLYCRLIMQLEKITPEMEDDFFVFARKHSSIGWVVLLDNWRLVYVFYVQNIPEAQQVIEEITFRFPTLIRERQPSIATRIYHFRRKYLYGKNDDERMVWGGGNEFQVDALDQKIIGCLTKNARIPCTEIAAQVKVSSVAVMNRIKRMEQQGLILGYRCALDLKKLGYTSIKVFLYLENVTKLRKGVLKEYLQQWLHCVYLTESFEKADFEFECHVLNLYVLHEFMKKMKAAFPEVRNHDSFINYREEIIRYAPKNFF